MASSFGSCAGIEHGGDVVDGERAVGSALDPTPLRHPGPGEQVGVVLHHRGHDDVVGCEPQPVGQVVDGLGGVAAQHDHVVVLAATPGETMGALAGALVGGGGPAGLVAGPAVHARVPGEEVGHRVGHHVHGGRRGGAVQVAVGAFGPVEAGDEESRPDQVDRGCLGRHLRHTTDDSAARGTLGAWKSATNPNSRSRPACSMMSIAPSNA